MSAESNGVSAFEEYCRLIGELPSGIAGSVELVARQLSETAEKLLRLGSIPHSIDMEVAAVLMPEVGRDALEAVAEELRPLSFVIRTSEGGMLHDEVRAYLFGQWLQAHGSDNDKWLQFKEVSARLADYYGDLTERMVGEAKAVAERQRVFHLVGADRKRGFDQFQRLCRAERYRYRLDSCEALIKLMREYEPILSAEMRNWLDYHEAKLLLDLRHHDGARIFLERLMKRDSATADPALFSRCLFRLAGAVRETRDFEQARQVYLHLKSYASSKTEARDQGLRAMQGLGSLLIEMGRTDEAEEIVAEVLMLAKEGDNRSALATAWNTMGILHRKLGRPKRALEAFAEALKELELSGEVYRPRQVYNNIGLLYADRAEWKKARVNLEKSCEIARKAGDMDGEATALSNLGRVYLVLSRPSEALAAAERAIQLFQTVHNWYGAAMTNRGMARYYRREGRVPEARAALGRAQDLFLRAGSRDRAEEAEREIEKLDKKVAKLKKASGRRIVVVLSFALILLLALIFFFSYRAARWS